MSSHAPAASGVRLTSAAKIVPSLRNSDTLRRLRRVLGVPRDADAKAIKKAFRRLESDGEPQRLAR